MKKIKLLLAAFAAMVTMGVQAQTWTASEVGAGNFVLYNVGKGQFLTRGNGYGTQASVSANSALTLTLEEYDGAYKLRTNINGSGKGIERLGDPVIYTDQSTNKNSTWTFTKVADASNGPVYTIVSTDNHNGGAGSYMTASADNTIVAPAEAVTDDYGRWQLVKSWITNSVPVSDTNGWTTSQAPTFDGGNVCAEFWNKSGASIKQTLSNLPVGSYELIAVAFTRTGMTATLNAGFNTMNIATAGTDEANNRGQANTWFNNGNGVNKLEFTHLGGSLEIGLTADNTTGDHWLVWRSFVLLYKGLDLSELKAALQAQIDAVSALEGTIPDAAFNAAKNYADGINMDAMTTEEAICTAASELSALVDAAKAMQSAYSGYLFFKAAIDVLDDDATIFTGDATIDLSAIDAPIQSTTTLEELNAAIETAKPLMQAKAAEFLTAVTVNEGKRFDITNIYLTNADFEVPTANGQMPPGWTITIGGANCGQQNRTDTNPETGLAITNFIEAWHWSQITSGVIAQTVSSLPEGTYVLECDASICHDPAGADDITGADLFIQSPLKIERQAISNVRLYINHYSLSFVHSGEGEVTFGLEANNTNANWLSADNFKVYFAGGIDYKSILEATIAEFEALENSIDPTIYAIYAAVVAEYNKTWSSKSEYQTAIAAVSQASEDMQAHNSAKLSYDAALTAATSALNDEANVNVTGEERTALNTAITDTPENTKESYEVKLSALTTTTSAFIDATPSYDKFVAVKAETERIWGSDFGVAVPTTAAEATVAVQAFNIAQYNKVVSEYTFSATGLIGDFGSWTGTATEGGVEAKPNYLDWEHWSGTAHAYYEQSAGGYGNDNGWTIQYEKTCTLPAGSYVIKVAARSSAGTTSTIRCSATEVTIPLPNVGGAPNRGINTSGVASWSDEDTFANGDIRNEANAPTVGGKGTGWQWRFLPFTLDKETEVTMTFYAEATTKYQWMSIADGELLSTTKLAQDVAYDEAAENVITNTIIADVTLTREINAGYNAVVVPFNLTANQVIEAFGAGTVVYNFNEASEDANDVTINFKKGDGSIAANTPVLVKATAASTSQIFKGVQIVAPTADVKVEGTNVNFVGSYAPIAVEEGDIFIDNGNFYKSEGSTDINAFRAYLDVKTAPENIKLLIDGVETDIKKISDVLMGDVNGDNIVDNTDAIAIAFYILGAAPTGFIEGVADYNGDGNIDVTDVASIAFYVLSK